MRSSIDFCPEWGATHHDIGCLYLHITSSRACILLKVHPYTWNTQCRVFGSSRFCDLLFRISRLLIPTNLSQSDRFSIPTTRRSNITTCPGQNEIGYECSRLVRTQCCRNQYWTFPVPPSLRRATRESTDSDAPCKSHDFLGVEILRPMITADQRIAEFVLL
jgi:hypothetical protein